MTSKSDHISPFTTCSLIMKTGVMFPSKANTEKKKLKKTQRHTKSKGNVASSSAYNTNTFPYPGPYTSHTTSQNVCLMRKRNSDKVKHWNIHILLSRSHSFEQFTRFKLFICLYPDRFEVEIRAFAFFRVCSACYLFLWNSE